MSYGTPKVEKDFMKAFNNVRILSSGYAAMGTKISRIMSNQVAIAQMLKIIYDEMESGETA